MSVLSKLKIVAVPPKSGLTPEQQRRAKVIAKLQEQLKLAEAALGGPAYERQRWGWATDENGEKIKVPRPIRIKTWWDETPTGAVQFGDDWPGVFIRGDDAFGLRMMLEDVLAGVCRDRSLEHLIRLLDESNLNEKTKWKEPTE